MVVGFLFKIIVKLFGGLKYFVYLCNVVNQINFITMENIQEVTELAETQMEKHGLTQRGWSFMYHRGKTTLGKCNVTKKRIALSIYFVQNNLDKKEAILDTILHEIAHGLDYIINGYSGHGKNWQKICLEIGANPTRINENKNVKMPKGKYEYVCPHCGHSVNFHRKLKRNIACKDCCTTYANGKYNERFKLLLK